MVTAASGLEESRPTDPTRALEHLTTLLRDDLDQVNRIIVEHMHSPVDLIPQLAGHIIAAGGKRLRPLLTLAGARLCGYEGEGHCALAACVEFIHTATLLHDDVVDESEMRRATATANALWGNKASVLVGDFLFSRAFELMVAQDSMEVMAILSRASSVIAEGEVLQLVTANNIATDEAAYLQVIESKTAELFAAAARLGGVVAGEPALSVDALERFGRNLGVAFQVVDDVLDYSAEQSRLGKRVGDDFRDGKITLPIVLAVARAEGDERAFWIRTLEDQDLRDDDLDHAMMLLGRHRALDDSMARAKEYVDRARTDLVRFPDGPVRQALDAVLDFVIDRPY